MQNSSDSRVTEPVPILCGECKARPAAVFLTHVVDGKLVHRNLCAHCASPYFDHPPEAPSATFLSPPSVNPDFLARPRGCPESLALPASVSLDELSQKLRAKPFHILAVLVTHGVFVTGKQPLDYATAATVCRHYGVSLRPVEGVEASEPPQRG